MAKPHNDVDAMPPNSNASLAGDLAVCRWEQLINTGEHMAKLGLRMSTLGTERSRPQHQDLVEMMQVGSHMFNVGVLFHQESPATTIAATPTSSKRKASWANDSGSNSENKRIRLGKSADILAFPPSPQFTQSSDDSPDRTGTSAVPPALSGSAVGEQINKPYDVQHNTDDDLANFFNESLSTFFDLDSGVAPADSDMSDGSSQGRQVSRTVAEPGLGDASLYEPLPFEPLPVEGATSHAAIATSDPDSGVAPADDEKSDGSSQARRVSKEASEIDRGDVSLLESLPVEGVTASAAFDPAPGVAPADDEKSDGSNKARRVSETAAEIAASASSIAGVVTSGFDPDGQVTSITNDPSSDKDQSQVKKQGRRKTIPYLDKLVADTAPKMTLVEYLQKTDGKLICLCGRGGHNQHHAGNRDYLNVIESKLPGYKPLSRTEKEVFTNSLVQEFEHQGRRFFRVNEGTDEWEEMDKRAIRRKVSQNFRDAKSLGLSCM